MKTNEIIFILYVKNQKLSCEFYKKILQKEPVLDVEGMTEFQLSDTAKLGIMPSKGIKKLLGNKISDPNLGHNIPRSEVYLYVDDIQVAYQNACRINARLISEISVRDWGDTVCYFADLDGHIIAFAEKTGRK